VVTATIFEAKTKLSELIRKAQAGEEVIITSGREKKPVARITLIESAPKKRRLGIMYNPEFQIPDTFWEPLPEEELKLWEGGTDEDFDL